MKMRIAIVDGFRISAHEQVLGANNVVTISQLSINNKIIRNLTGLVHQQHGWTNNACHEMVDTVQIKMRNLDMDYTINDETRKEIVAAIEYVAGIFNKAM